MCLHGVPVETKLFVSAARTACMRAVKSIKILQGLGVHFVEVLGPLPDTLDEYKKALKI